MSKPTGEFVTANSVAIDTIAAEARNFIKTQSNVCVTQLGNDSRANVTETPFTAEYYIDAFPGSIDETTAEELAIQDKENLRALGAIAISTLATRSTMYHIVDIAQNGEDPGDVSILRFAKGEYRKAFIASDTFIERTVLNDVEALGAADNTNICTVDEYATSTLSLLHIGNSLELLDFRIEPNDDHDLNRWITLLGESFDKYLLKPAAGAFKDTEELDMAIAAAYDDFHGSSQEEQVQYALAEIRKRAIAAQASRNMTAQFDLGIPSAEMLRQMAQKLKSI